MSLQVISQYANAITQACGLDTNQAKTVVNWAVATHAMDKLTVMPILVVEGVHGSGKSTLLAAIFRIAHAPMFIDGKVTEAVLKRLLKPFTTALIEEADGVKESLILKRYSLQTASTIVNEGSGAKGWTLAGMAFFGATGLHKRQPFADPALDSRSIVIRTSRKPGPFSTFMLDEKALAGIAGQVNWSQPLAVLSSGRAADTWMPLFQAARDCGDVDWIRYALDELKKAMESLNQGQGQEPSQLVVAKLIALGIDTNANRLKDRVALKEIKKGLKEDGDILSSWQISKILRGLGLETKLMGGTEYVYLDKVKLLAIAAQVGIDDDELKKL